MWETSVCRGWTSQSGTTKGELFVTRQEIACTLYDRVDPKHRIPCIVYCHSHSGNRFEGTILLDVIGRDFDLCVLEFSGYGYSQGKYSTLGLKESEELEVLVNYLKKEKKIDQLFLWGRSMGAVSILLYLHRLGAKAQEACQGVVLDSPFSSTKDMVLGLDCSFVM
jgi:alpha-beta hydrolase superfamily lysophospholipase